MSQRPHVVIVGSGFGGLNAAKALRKAPVDVTLVDGNNFHLFQPLLYQVAIAGLDADDIAYPTRGIVRKLGNVTFRLGRVTALDPGARTLTLADGATLTYDRLILAAGAVTNTFGVPGADTNAHGMKTLRDAERIRTAILRRFEAAAAAVAAGRPVPEGALAIAIVGGGPTGVELAGGLQELLAHGLRRDFPSLDVDGARVTLVEATDRVLGTFAPKLSSRAARTLERMGVTLQLGTGVSAIEPGAVVLADGRRITAGTVIWAAGVKAGPLAAASGLPLGRGGRIVVDERLRVPTHPDITVVGDIGASLDRKGEVLPQVAQVAIQGGRYAGRAVCAELVASRSLPGFRYRDKGIMATIGRHAAVAQVPIGLRLWGPVGWAAWLGLHIVYLIGFRNRINVLVNWSWNYLTYDHGSRLIESEDA
jgi:NADH dehydrogenase